MGTFIEALRYAGRPIELNAKPGDHILVVTDLAMPKEITDALFAAAYSLGHDVSMATCTPRQAHGDEPPATVADAMCAADVVLLATSTSMAHSAATIRAAASGTRCVFMEEVTLDMLCRGAATADYDKVGRLATAIGEKWNAGNTVKVTSRLGTDLEANIAGRRSWQMAGRAFAEDWFALSGCCAFPDGECGVAPVEGSANGVVVFDTTVQGVGLLDEPVRLTVEASRITSVDGGHQATLLRERLEALGDPNAYYCPAEIAIGINEAAEITGILREDKKLLGSCHIAYGANKDLGGTIESSLHIDGLIRYPTVEIDGELIVRDGEVLVAPQSAPPPISHRVITGSRERQGS